MRRSTAGLRWATLAPALLVCLAPTSSHAGTAVGSPPAEVSAVTLVPGTPLLWTIAGGPSATPRELAPTRCAEVERGDLADWRLPTVDELTAAFAESRGSLAAVVGWPTAGPSTVWGLTTLVQPSADGEDRYGLVFDLVVGTTATRPADEIHGTVCVRPKEDAPGRFELRRPGVAVDTDTGLEWTTDGGDGTNLRHAFATCEELDRDGGGWRLPRLSELERLLVPSAEGLRLAPPFQIDGCCLWSSDVESLEQRPHYEIRSDEGGPEALESTSYEVRADGWLLDVRSGVRIVRPADRKREHRAICVRGGETLDRRLEEAAGLDQRARDADSSAQERLAEEALVGYREACEGGRARGCLGAARLLHQGALVSPDLAAAARFYYLGCSATEPDAEACFDLATIHFYGELGARDLGAAGAYFRRACLLGHSGACTNLEFLCQRVDLPTSCAGVGSEK